MPGSGVDSKNHPYRDGQAAPLFSTCKRTQGGTGYAPLLDDRRSDDEEDESRIRTLVEKILRGGVADVTEALEGIESKMIASAIRSDHGIFAMPLEAYLAVWVQRKQNQMVFNSHALVESSQALRKGLV